MHVTGSPDQTPKDIIAFQSAGTSVERLFKLKALEDKYSNPRTSQDGYLLTVVQDLLEELAGGLHTY